MSRCASNLPWGYEAARIQNNNQVLSPDPHQTQLQYANLPAVLLSTLKRDKKPFTYTPGGVNLSQVLEARLQKRMERKKKYQEEVEQDHRNQLLVVSPTYNSPLNMYSMENALETLEVQAKMAANRSSSSCTLPRNYKFKFEAEEDVEPSQSKAFRVLQVMTDTELYSGNKKLKDGPNVSEMRFTGLREGRPTNPSKFFHTLQKITGTDADEEEEETQESVKLEHAPSAHPIPTCTSPPYKVPTKAPPLQQQPSFGSAPKLKRPAAFLPKQQSWSYQRMPAITPVGTDF